MVKIISDSTCDLTENLLEKYNISILPLNVLLGEDEFLDGDLITQPMGEEYARCARHGKHVGIGCFHLFI